MFDEERLDDHHECKAAYEAAIRRAERAEVENVCARARIEKCESVNDALTVRVADLEAKLAEAEEVRDATIKVRDDVLMELESWKVRHQDEVNARVNAENDLYAMGQERQREHALRVKINNEAEELRIALTAERTRREALEAALKKIATVHCALVSGSCKPPYLCATCIARAALSSGKTDMSYTVTLTVTEYDALKARIAALEAAENRIRLNRAQVQVMLDYIDLCVVDVETEIIIGYQDVNTEPESGEQMPAGVYMWDGEYPEEGCMYLDPT